MSEDEPPEQPKPPESQAPTLGFPDEVNPYAPPKSDWLTPLPPPNPGFTGMSFPKRLLVLPVWFILGVFPVGIMAMMIVVFITDLEYRFRSPAFGILFVAVVLTVCIPMYTWLVRPFQWSDRRRLRWAWLGVPLMAVVWGAFLIGILVCINEALRS